MKITPNSQAREICLAPWVEKVTISVVPDEWVQFSCIHLAWPTQLDHKVDWGQTWQNPALLHPPHPHTDFSDVTFRQYSHFSFRVCVITNLRHPKVYCDRDSCCLSAVNREPCRTLCTSEGASWSKGRRRGEKRLIHHEAETRENWEGRWRDKGTFAWERLGVKDDFEGVTKRSQRARQASILPFVRCKGPAAVSPCKLSTWRRVSQLSFTASAQVCPKNDSLFRCFGGKKKETGGNPQTTCKTGHRRPPRCYSQRDSAGASLTDARHGVCVSVTVSHGGSGGAWQTSQQTGSATLKMTSQSCKHPTSTGCCL